MLLQYPRPDIALPERRHSGSRVGAGNLQLLGGEALEPSPRASLQSWMLTPSTEPKFLGLRGP